MTNHLLEASRELGRTFEGFERISVALGADGEDSTFAYCGADGELEIRIGADGARAYTFRTWAELGY